MATIEVSTRPTDAGVVLDLVGDIDAAARGALDAAYSEAAPAAGREVVLDFSRVGYINSTGIALIVGLLARARSEQVRVGARGLSDHYRGIFEITRLSDFMTIYPAMPSDPDRRNER